MPPVIQEEKHSFENTNSKSSSLQGKQRSLNDDNDDNANNIHKKFLYNSLTFKTPYQKQNKSHSSYYPGGRTQIERFSSDNQNSRYKKYVPPGGGGDGLTYSHDDNGDLKEDKKSTSFSKNIYNQKYTPPRGKNIFSMTLVDDDDHDEYEKEEKNISFNE